MRKELDLDQHAQDVEKIINNLIITSSGDYLYQHLATALEKELIRPLIQSGIVKELSHIELFLKGKNILNIPLGEGGLSVSERSDPATTVVVADYPLEAVQKTAQKIVTVSENLSEFKPQFNIYIVSKK